MLHEFAQLLCLGRMPNKATVSPAASSVKMALGEAPETITGIYGCPPGSLAAAQSLDGGVIDRIVNRFAGTSASRAYIPLLQDLTSPILAHLHLMTANKFWVGAYFPFRCSIWYADWSMIDSLNQIPTVEAAMPNHVCVTPFGSAMPVAQDTDWAPWQIIRAHEALAYEPGDLR